MMSTRGGAIGKRKRDNGLDTKTFPYTFANPAR
jgi:hypothetical protein